jgi:hypothetical protein
MTNNDDIDRILNEYADKKLKGVFFGDIRTVHQEAKSAIRRLLLEARKDELEKYTNIVENAPGDGMDWLDGIFHRLDTKLTHANQSIFFDVQINEGTAALREAKKLFALHFQGRIAELESQLKEIT